MTSETSANPENLTTETTANLENLTSETTANPENLTSETTANPENLFNPFTRRVTVLRQSNILIEEDLTQMQKLMIYSAFIGLLLWLSASFYYQELEYAQSGHPMHERYRDAVVHKRVYLTAAIIMFLWYLYMTFFIEPYYHKYIRPKTEKKQKDDQKKTSAKYDEPTQKRDHSIRMDLMNPKFPTEMRNDKVTKSRNFLRLPLTSLPEDLKPVLPKKMTLGEFEEWRWNEENVTQVPKNYYDLLELQKKPAGRKLRSETQQTV